MATSSRGAVSLYGGLLLLTALIPGTMAAVEHDICASFNTADTGRNHSIYQTNSLCSDFCEGDSAYAITQGENCWCSDYTPSSGSQVSKGRCDQPCPAWQPESCGGRGVFSYMELNKSPEGSKGPDDDDDDSSPTTTASDDDKEPSSTSMVQTLTTDGTTKTVTVIPTQTYPPDADEGNNSGGSNVDDDDGGLGTGAIVGIVVGVLAAVAIVGGVLFWFFKRRKRNADDGYEHDPSVRGNSSDRIGSAHPEMSMGAGRGGSPSSNMGSSNRNSTLAIDPRMDPFKQGLYMRNQSQESINTLRDDHDYSRRIQQPKVLRATNPDPDNP